MFQPHTLRPSGSGLTARLEPRPGNSSRTDRALVFRRMSMPGITLSPESNGPAIHPEIVYGGEGGGRTCISAPFYIVGVSSDRTAGITQPTAHLSHPSEESNLCGPRTAVVLPHQLKSRNQTGRDSNPRSRPARRTLYIRIRCSPLHDRGPTTRSGCAMSAQPSSHRGSAPSHPACRGRGGAPRVVSVRRSFDACTEEPARQNLHGDAMSVADWIRLSRIEGVRPSRRPHACSVHTAALLSLSGGWLAVSTAESSRFLSLPDGKEIEDAILHARHDMTSSRRSGHVPGWQASCGGPAGNQRCTPRRTRTVHLVPGFLL